MSQAFETCRSVCLRQQFSPKLVCVDFFQRQGCVHGEELPYVFGAPLVGGLSHFPRNYTKAEVQLSEAVMIYWSNFARTGWVVWKGIERHGALLSLDNTETRMSHLSQTRRYSTAAGRREIDSGPSSGRPTRLCTRNTSPSVKTNIYYVSVSFCMCRTGRITRTLRGTPMDLHKFSGYVGTYTTEWCSQRDTPKVGNKICLRLSFFFVFVVKWMEKRTADGE